MAETDESTPPNPNAFPDFEPFLDPDPDFEVPFELLRSFSCDLEVDDQLEPASKLDREWGYIYNVHCSPTWKNGGGGMYSSNESPVSGALTSTSNFISYPPFLSSDGTNKPSKDGGDQEEETTKRHSYTQNFGDKVKERENLFERNLSCDFHSLPSEHDGDEIAASKSGADEMLSEPSAYLSEKNREVNFQLPDIGMEFSSEEEAYKFYKNYARGTGFSVRKGKVQRLSNGKIRKRFFFCSKQGFRLKKQHETKYKRKETRTGCEAKLQFIVENGKWMISQVCLQHNHDLESPSQLDKTGSCTKISEADTILLTVNEAGKVNEEGNANHVLFHDMDCSNYLRDKKINCLQPEDVQSLINSLKHLQLEDQSFFYSVQVDAENRLTNFFWRDGRSKIDYDYFGDILILDTQFQMSIYGMICAPFWGVNHHRQYILFGCAFLLDESVDSLSWLLDTFMEAMGRRPPKTIVTDESEAMAKAIEVVLPETRHCLSLQYICQKARKHLSAYFEQEDFESLFNKCIFDCQSVKEYESMWDSLLEQHNLHENSWLNSIYRLWDKWSHVFCMKTFSAGIQSSHGSENINNIFQNVDSEIMTLPKFVQQYERAALQRRREELYEDNRCNGNAPALTLRSNAMEKQAANSYTHTMFEIFKVEIFGCLSVAIEEIINDGSAIATFKLTEGGDKKENIVEFNCLDSRVTCSCGKFESIGILCVHALKVLNARNIFHIPPQYVLKRWTKCAKEGVVEDDHGAERADKRPRPLNLCTSTHMQKALNVITKRGRKIIVDQKIKEGEIENFSLSKRKKEKEDPHTESGTSKHRRSSTTDSNPLYSFIAADEEENRGKAWLVRNLKSAQLSSQRKKHYVEELEHKLRTMNSTIVELHGKISFLMAENSSLRRPLSSVGGSMCLPPPPGMYPHMAPVAYPWLPCAPYVARPHGSLPLVPIPRLKAQTPMPLSRAMKDENKKTVGKTKKVASISFLGLLFFMILFGGLIPIVNVKFGGIGDGGMNYVREGFYDQHRGRVLTVSGHLNGSDKRAGVQFSNEKFNISNRLHSEKGRAGGSGYDVVQKGQGSLHVPVLDEFLRMGNDSEPLVASLNVLRNDKLVKIDGDLIIHSVLSSEKAMASRSAPEINNTRETSSAMALAIPKGGGYTGRNATMVL